MLGDQSSELRGPHPGGTGRALEGGPSACDTLHPEREETLARTSHKAKCPLLALLGPALSPLTWWLHFHTGFPQGLCLWQGL